MASRPARLVERPVGVSDDECWEWPLPASRQSGKCGYGVVRFQGKNQYVHRVMFYLTYGHWPEPECRHTCDNPPCFNPRHLLEGTALDNVHDCWGRGRENGQWVSRLSQEDKDMIVKRYVSGESSIVVAQDFGISKSYVTLLAIKQHQGVGRGNRRPQTGRRIVHGTHTGYQYGCRCGPCREAGSTYNHAYYQRSLQNG